MQYKTAPVITLIRTMGNVLHWRTITRVNTTAIQIINTIVSTLLMVKPKAAI